MVGSQHPGAPTQIQEKKPPGQKTLGTRFRLSCKRIFLTYPQCSVPKAEAAEQIKAKLKNNGIERLVIGQE